MQRTHAFVLVLMLLFTSGVVLSQSVPAGTPEATAEPTPEVAFKIESEIGRALPRKIVYDPQRERMAVADAYNRLLLVNALDYATIAVLYERGEYNDIAFSHDGRWLAVAYGDRMDVWDTDTGRLSVSLGNLNAKRLIGPIQFSAQDEILIFYGIYPAPRALRQSETDTITYPWVWHLPAARQEAPSSFPNGVNAVQMFDYPFGFVLSPDDKVVAALPARLRVLDVYTLAVEHEITTDRYEQDPLRVWFSLRDNTIYTRPLSGNTLLQVDTRRGVLVEIPMNAELTLDDLGLIGGLEVGSIARVVGGQASRVTVPLLQVFLGYYYRDEQIYGNRALTVTLVDLVVPPTGTQDNVRALLFVYDELKRTGVFRFSESGAAQQMVLSPDGNQILVRRYDGDEYIITYDLDTGQEFRRFLPALRAIGSYSRTSKNRVLAYDLSGQVIISDFQRLKANTNEILAEDLRYSRSFDRFFWSDDSQKIITLAGSEWREWSVATGEVLRREVVYMSGSIIATSPDGYRYLARFDTQGGGGGVEVVDMSSGERYTVSFAAIPGSYVAEVYPNASWTRFLVVYSENRYGPYTPGNQIALYHYRDGLRAFLAGDDLPPVGQRLYGWVDEDTAYVYGQGAASSQPGRVYGVEYAPSGLPACLEAAFPQQVDSFLKLWEWLLLNLRADQMDDLARQLCDSLPQTAAEAEQRLLPTPAPTVFAVTGVPTGEVPQCLKDRYPAEAEAYSDLWRAITAGSSEAERQRLAVLLCEGIGEIRPPQEFDPSLGITLFINGDTGERASGDFRSPVVERRPLEPVYALFEKTEKRSLGTAILSRDKQLLAASSLPGELVIYRLIVSYDTIMGWVTATAAAQLAEANLIVAMPSPSPTYNPIGTPRPTLTPTPRQTLVPRPTEYVFPDGVRDISLCPSETLYSISSPPAEYDATGRMYAEVFGDYLWVVEPEDGTRREDPDLLQCGRGVRCQFSPDKAWILAESYDYIYVVRPDNSDPRVLWDLRTPYPPTPVPSNLWWSGDRTLEWQARIPVTAAPTSAVYYEQAYIRDVMNVYPDPPPWIPRITINRIPAQFISRQPGGPWALASTSYSTGTGLGYKYYLYNTETGAYLLFAQNEYNEINLYWHPSGDRLFYRFPTRNGYTSAYQVTFPENSNRYLNLVPDGVWSNDGRYLANSTRSRIQQISVWDSQTGLYRTYCLPETGARLYDGPFVWSPDSRYLALLTPLPKDEAREGVGQHTLILNIETGQVVDLTTGVTNILIWAQEPGTYGDGRVMTPTPTAGPTTTP